jgi:hypothetical protein
MDGGIARKPADLRWLVTPAVALGVLGLGILLWHYQGDYQARQQAQAAKREAWLAALRGEEEARRMETERQAAKVRTIERVGQLYREIDGLSQLGDHVQTSFRERLRVLKSSEPKSQATP